MRACVPIHPFPARSSENNRHESDDNEDRYPSKKRKESRSLGIALAEFSRGGIGDPEAERHPEKQCDIAGEFHQYTGVAAWSSHRRKERDEHREGETHRAPEHQYIHFPPYAMGSEVEVDNDRNQQRSMKTTKKLRSLLRNGEPGDVSDQQRNPEADEETGQASGIGVFCDGNHILLNCSLAVDKYVSCMYWFGIRFFQLLSEWTVC